jgi:hypothetical protein
MNRKIENMNTLSNIKISVKPKHAFTHPTYKQPEFSELADYIFGARRSNQIVQNLVFHHLTVKQPEEVGNQILAMLRNFVPKSSLNVSLTVSELVAVVIKHNWSRWMAGAIDIEFPESVPVTWIIDLPDIPLTTTVRRNDEGEVDVQAYAREAVIRHWPEFALDSVVSADVELDDDDNETETAYNQFKTHPSFELLKELVSLYDVYTEENVLITDVFKVNSSIVAELDNDEAQVIKLTDKFTVDE